MSNPDLAASNLLWRLRDVTLRGVGRARLERVSLDIGTGTTAVIGYSGAGKTSLLNLLVGFERVDEGWVESSGVLESSRARTPPAPSSQAREGPRETIGNDGRLPLFWVPQTDGLWPHLNVIEHLTTVLPSDAKSAAAEELLAEFDLVAIREARPDRLSQGERSRLAVARALASHAVLLVMDEPLVHVDPARAGTYWSVVRDHCRATASSLVVATHSPEVVLREAERVVCLNDGRVEFSGDVRTLYDCPQSLELARFLGPINWFTPDEASRWLGVTSAGDICCRPERLSVLRVEASPFVIRSSRFAGSVAEVELADDRGGPPMAFFHRPLGDELRSGDRVTLRVAGAV